MSDMKTPSSVAPLALRCTYGRVCAIQWLFHKHTSPFSSATLEDIQSILKSEYGGDFQPDSVILRRILKSYDQNHDKIQDLIIGHLPPKWPLHSLDPVIFAIFKASIAEALTQKTPFKVILREYSDIASQFYAEKEISFIHKVINGILTSIGYAPTLQNGIHNQEN